jgi:chorismate mutase
LFTAGVFIRTRLNRAEKLIRRNDKVSFVVKAFADTTCRPLLLFSSIESQCQKVSDPATRLASYRKQIDATDQQIVALLNRRARIVAEVGKIKKEAHLPVAAPAREEQVLDRIIQLGGAGPLPPDRLRRIYQTVIQEMRTWEEGLSEEGEDKPAK